MTDGGDRVERLLALILLELMGTATQQKKAVRLSGAGFTSVEIADLLGTSAQVVRNYQYESRKSEATRQSSRKPRAK